MNRYDLEVLDGLLSKAANVCGMSEIYDGADLSDTIGLRHDCDNVIQEAVWMAEWEAQRGYRSTYYILHTAPYWQRKDELRRALDELVYYGHEIGIHNDAITAQLETGVSAAAVLSEAVEELRDYGHTIRSTVAHGHARCGVDRYVNDEMFAECFRPVYGEIQRLGVETYPLASFGLEFDANWLHRGDYLSDSGGSWSQPFVRVATSWPSKGQLHCLVHPDWWTEALEPEQAAA